LHTDGREGFAHLIELERLDDGSDEFHFSLVGVDQKVLVRETTPLVSPR
jgi:hypothetical protein